MQRAVLHFPLAAPIQHLRSASPTMAQNYNFKHFTVQFPAEHKHVAHVEINRADKMNAFFEASVIPATCQAHF